MYKLPALIIAANLLLNLSSWSQKKLTLSAFTGSGISVFGGPGAVSKSTFHISSSIFGPNGIIPDTVEHPFGKKPFVNFLAGLQADLRLNSKWTIILSSQYEHTGGILTADTVVSSSGTIKTDGKYSRYYDFISVNPQIGRIVFQKPVTITFHTGIDYTSKLDRGENIDYTNQNGQKQFIGASGGEPEKNDLRICFGALVTRHKWSIDVNYKHGLVNYWKDGPGKVYSRLLQIRVQYSLFSKEI